MAEYFILVVNPGSTSTKVAVYADEEQIHERNLQHVKLDLEGFPKIWDQYAFRKRIILDFLEEVGIDLKFNHTHKPCLPVTGTNLRILSRL